jgi:hypothetical protein
LFWGFYRYLYVSLNLVTKKSNLALSWRSFMSLLVLAGLSNGLMVCRSATFSNTAPINFPAGAPVVPYPSSNVVSGVTGLVTSVSATLVNLTHPSPDDIDVLLVGPGGQTVVLMSDAGGSNAVSGTTLTFTDASSVSLPDTTRLLSGTYRPSNYSPADSFPSAPAGPYGVNFSGFTGTPANGAWRLFVVRDTGSAVGSIAGGWRLHIESANPPVIVSHPQSQTVAPGATVTFGVGVSGTPPFGYQWLRNGQVLVPFGAGGASLTISNVQAANAGTYAVVVTNAANRIGVTSSNATLNVSGPLTIVESPRDQLARPGETVLFRMTATGTPPPHYQWRLNGEVLPNETNSTLLLSNVEPATGGALSVTVFNGVDVLTTEPALLVVDGATGSPPENNFRDRPTLEAPKGILQGNSAMADVEPGEPVSPGGGKSVWYEWVAPDDGIVTLTSRGSAFDTLLNVFSNRVAGTAALSNLVLIARDDNEGGFHTSSLLFNAQRGMRYQIMLDGFDFKGAGGEFTLSWDLEVTEETVPVVRLYPRSLGIQEGSDGLFRVLGDSADITYQWFFNGLPLRGETSTVLSLMRARVEDIGFYSVELRNQWGRTVKTPPVDMQLGFTDNVFAVDRAPESGLRPSQGVISVGLGETGWNQFPSQASGGAGDPNPCNQPFFKTLFQKITAEDNGVIQVDTIDSQVYMLLGVYQGTPTGVTNLDVLVACDTVSGPANQVAVTKFNATQGSNYTAVVSALQGNGTQTIKITCKMGVAPAVPNAPKYCLIVQGGSLVLEMPATNWCPLPACQWQMDGFDILNATNLSLVVTQAGTYSVFMSNFVSTASTIVAYVEVAGPFLLEHALQTNNANVRFLITASNAAPFVLQTTTNLIEWVSLLTNPNPCVPIIYTNPLVEPRRFFRAIPWP